jgi:hypothetical protein
VSKNGVNTCPPILEYKITNAPKFTLDNDYHNYLLEKNLLPNPSKSSPDFSASINIAQPPTIFIPTKAKAQG